MSLVSFTYLCPALLPSHFSFLPQFFSLCEIPSCHTEVATNIAAMKQFSRVILCPLFDAETIRNSAILCLTLGYSEATHRYLVEAGLVDTLTSHTQPRIGQNEMEDVLTQ